MNIFLNINDVIFGNDIVDLSDPDCSIDHINQRFVDRVCTEKEKNIFFKNPLEKNLDNLITLWKLWALKESAYKTISRVYFVPVFRYKDYEVQEKFQKVVYKNLELYTQIFLEDNLLYTITYSFSQYDLNKNPIESFIFFSFIKKNTNKNSNDSKEIRKFTKEIFFNYFKKHITIYRHYDIQHKVYMPPYLYIDKEFFPISLSHHGNFLVFTLGIQRGKEKFLLNFFKEFYWKSLDNHYIIFNDN